MIRTASVLRFDTTSPSRRYLSDTFDSEWHLRAAIGHFYAACSRPQFKDRLARIAGVNVEKVWELREVREIFF